MKTYVGDLFLELPDTWGDSSNYCFRKRDRHETEVRIERSVVPPNVPAAAQFESIVERMRLLSPEGEVTRENITIANREAASFRTTIKRDGDKEATLMFVACFKSTADTCVTITVLGSDLNTRAFEASCESIVKLTRVVDVN